MPTKVLVTGSNGFIGSHLVQRLIEKGYNLKCMLRKSSNIRWIKDLSFECAYADFCDFDSLQIAVKDVEEIYHLGGTVRVVHHKVYYEVNSEGTRNLVEAVKRYNPVIKKFVYVSSQAAWGPHGKEAVSHYGKSKAEGENWVKQLNNYSIVRPVAVYGPRDSDFLPVFRMARKGFFLKPRSGVGKLSFIHVNDCVEGILNADIGEEVFLSDGRDYSWEDLLEVLEEVFNRKIKCIKLPETLIRLMGIFGTLSGKLKGIPVKLNYDKVREMFGGDWIVPGTSVEAKYDLIDGFKQTLNWYINQGWIK